jgi:hypothetical protein
LPNSLGGDTISRTDTYTNGGIRRLKDRQTYGYDVRQMNEHARTFNIKLYLSRTNGSSVIR